MGLLTAKEFAFEVKAVERVGGRPGGPVDSLVILSPTFTGSLQEGEGWRDRLRVNIFRIRQTGLTGGAESLEWRCRRADHVARFRASREGVSLDLLNKGQGGAVFPRA